MRENITINLKFRKIHDKTPVSESLSCKPLLKKDAPTQVFYSEFCGILMIPNRQNICE